MRRSFTRYWLFLLVFAAFAAFPGVADSVRSLAEAVKPLLAPAIKAEANTSFSVVPGTNAPDGFARLNARIPGGRPALARAQAAAGLRIEGFSVYSSDGESSREITISFRLVNAGAAITTPFHTRIFPGNVTGNNLEEFDLTTDGLAAGGTVYVARTLTLPADVHGIDVRIEADVGGVILSGQGPVVFGKFLSFLPPIPGQWVSIGPRRITAPAVPPISLGQFDATGRLGPIAIHPQNSQIIYVGSPGELGHEGSGVWKTTNGGLSWFPITDSFPTLAIAAIAIDPTNPDRVYVVTVDFGLFRSDDGGTNWSQIYSSDLKVRRNLVHDWAVLLISRREPNVLYLTTDDGVFRSDTGGTSWFNKLAGVATALVMDPRDPNILYAGIQGKGVYRTTNGGFCGDTCWQQESISANNLSPDGGILLGLSHPSGASPERVYALLGPQFGPDGFTLFRRGDDGVWSQTFACDPTPLPVRMRLVPYFRPGRAVDCNFHVMVVSPVDPEAVYLAGPSLALSGSGGPGMSRVYAPTYDDRQPVAPHGDFHGLAFDPTNPQVMFGATDGGIYRSSDRGFAGTWTFIGEGITNTEIYDLSVANTLPSRVLAGTQDNGTILYNGSPVWDHVFPHPDPAPPPGPCEGCGGDGATTAIDPTDANRFYAMGQFQDSLVRSDDHGVNVVWYAYGLPAQQKLPNGDWVPSCATFNATFHFQVHPSDSTTLLASCIMLWSTSTSSSNGNWSFIFDPSDGLVVRSAVDASIDLYYAGTAADASGAGGGRVYARPAGGYFQQVFAHPAGQSVSDIEVDPAKPDVVYASFARGPTLNRTCTDTFGRIYQLRRLSATPSTTMSATDITGNLPTGLCVNALAIDPYVPRVLYAATSKGVYQGRPAVSKGVALPGWSPWVWQEYMNGMPRADVRDLEVHRATRRMRAATYGRGAFEVITSPLKLVPLIVVESGIQ